ncbi:MAG: hypothetical protein A2W31_02830, partial [Planctomycetes bacterium RBG_16_64_10]
ARAALDQDVAASSPLRKVSINRLEVALEQRLADDRGPTEAMRYLAGLTRIEYVFYYPETHDIVMAGPAEGWGADLSGRVVGLTTGRPVLELQDLIVALRAFPPSGASTPAIYCSIDPTPEGLARMQQFLATVGGRATPADTPVIVQGLRESLGMQMITIGGVSPRTHCAQVLVEADYLMKLIGIGLEQPPIKLTSYVARASAASVSRNALERWYFVPEYECVRVSEDEFAMQLVGEGVKLISENELVSTDGSRAVSGRMNRASQAFVREFTQKYPLLAEKIPVFAQLRNMIDMVVAAAFLQQQDYYGQAGWNMGRFSSETGYAVETLPVPQQVDTAVNSLWKGNRLLTPVGGGVQIRPQLAIDPDHRLPDEEHRVATAREEIDIRALPKDQWWWD